MTTHPIEDFITSDASDNLVVSGGTAETVFFNTDNYKFKVWLYMDPAFDVWVADRQAEIDIYNPEATTECLVDGGCLDDDGVVISYPTTKELGYMTDYSSYTIRIDCDITNV